MRVFKTIHKNAYGYYQHRMGLFYTSKVYNSSAVESQKGAIRNTKMFRWELEARYRCIYRASMVIAPFWFSTLNRTSLNSDSALLALNWTNYAFIIFIRAFPVVVVLLSKKITGVHFIFTLFVTNVTPWSLLLEWISSEPDEIPLVE